MGIFQKLFSSKDQGKALPHYTDILGLGKCLRKTDMRAWVFKSREAFFVKSLSESDRKRYEKSSTTLERKALWAFSQVKDDEAKKFGELVDRGLEAAEEQNIVDLLRVVEEMKQLCEPRVSLRQKVTRSAGLYGRALAICGLLFMLLMLLYPPYLFTITVRGGNDRRLITQYDKPLGHRWIWDSPQSTYDYSPLQPLTSERHVDTEHLFIYLGIGGVVTVLGIVLMSQKRRVPRRL